MRERESEYPCDTEGVCVCVCVCVCVSAGSEWESVRVFATQREGEELVIRQVAGSGSVKIIKTSCASTYVPPCDLGRERFQVTLRPVSRTHTEPSLSHPPRLSRTYRNKRNLRR